MAINLVHRCNMATVVVDPGHGGTERVGGSSPNNAVGLEGTRECDLTLSVGLMVSGLLANLGHDVRLTRSTDVNLGLKERADVAKRWGAEVFVSIHFNGFHDRSVQGSETLHAPDASEASRKLAQNIQAAIVSALGHRDRGVKPQTLGVLRPENHHSQTAACLVEPSFLTNADEEKRLQDERYQVKIASAVVDGITRYLTEHATQ
ncbi:N-acetylmuramoyl-L-alanine amidase family protein [Rubripirellula amarantea]|nr:N-acetylmuramoyl-L-alanine amidase [Rubripirellula amarantea]